MPEIDIELYNGTHACGDIDSNIAEVQNARTGADGTSYQSLKERLDTESEAIDAEMCYNDQQTTYADLESGGFTAAAGKEASAKRIRTITPVFCKKGTTIRFSIGTLYYNVFELSDSSTSGGNAITSSGWLNTKAYTTRNDCYIMVTFATAETYEASESITVNDFVEYYLYQERIDAIENELFLIEKDISASKKYIYQGEYEQGGYSATAPTSSSQRIRMKEIVALPYGENTVLSIDCNSEYLFAVRAGRTAQNLSSNLYWYRSGQKITFSNHEQYYKIIWAKYAAGTTQAYADITPSEIATINPKITYSYKDGKTVKDIMDIDADSFEYLVNAENVLSDSSHGGTGTLPVIFHGSDFHGDRNRVENALKYAERFSADAIIFSGDMVANVPLDGCAWMHELFSSFNGKPIICTGNHEVDNSGYDDDDVYGYFMEPSAAKIGNTNGKTYYYTDISAKSLRIIVTDIYQYGATTRSNAHMTSEQLSYICNAMKTAPSGYGIIIVSHSPCVNVNDLASQDYSKFFQSLRKYGFSHYDITGTPIYDIVDAFNERGQINQTYTQTGSPSSISVSEDFSGVDSSVEFIAHVTGHIHEDSVCFLPTQTKQLLLNVCCGVAMTGGSSYPYLADDCDITKLPYGKTQDTINAYVIDRTNKTVKIVRIGGSLTYDMKRRDYMSIPYKD